VIRGDDLSARRIAPSCARAGRALDAIDVVSANAYLGAEPIAARCAPAREIVVAGAWPILARVGPVDGALRLAADDWDRLGRATMAGHLLECGAQVTGGYFADPGMKDVPGLRRVGFPIAEIDAEGAASIAKADDTGGMRSRRGP
jgi:hypothetical protein